MFSLAARGQERVPNRKSAAGSRGSAASSPRLPQWPRRPLPVTRPLCGKSLPPVLKITREACVTFASRRQNEGSEPGEPARKSSGPFPPRPADLGPGRQDLLGLPREQRGKDSRCHTRCLQLLTQESRLHPHTRSPPSLTGESLLRRSLPQSLSVQEKRGVPAGRETRVCLRSEDLRAPEHPSPLPSRPGSHGGLLCGTQWGSQPERQRGVDGGREGGTADQET